MGMKSFQFPHDASYVLSPFRDLDPGQILLCITVGNGVRCRADAADSLHKEDHLVKGFGFGYLFNASVVVTDINPYVGDLFTLHLQLEELRFFLQRMIRSYRDNGLLTHLLLLGSCRRG